jgi:L-asparaginase
MAPLKEISLPGPYTPTLILHGGAGNITRKNLPPELYTQYESSLLEYLDSTRKCLYSGASALDSAVHAVSLMEDDPLFNCGRGSVFTEKGTIEMEASVMVASVDPGRDGRDEGSRAAEEKRGAGVMLVRNTRHPIQLAREVLLVRPNGKASSMHCQLSGPDVEDWGWRERDLEREDDSWFWTKKRWAEHLRGLQKDRGQEASKTDNAVTNDDGDTVDVDAAVEDCFLPSQGTVGAVCMDSWGDVAVATSTGGLTNKKVGRIGDTPTLGAGFWAESWEESIHCPSPMSTAYRHTVGTKTKTLALTDRLATAIDAGFGDLLQGCFPHLSNGNEHGVSLLPPGPEAYPYDCSDESMVKKQPQSPTSTGMVFGKDSLSTKSKAANQRRAVAISGTGNGDSFLRTAACRTTAAICRFSTRNSISNPISLATAVGMTAGPDGEMQKSAGDRWMATGEGQAGIIGIEVCGGEPVDKETQAFFHASMGVRRTGQVIFDFNCGGLWRAWEDEKTGKGKVMVFREDYH